MSSIFISKASNVYAKANFMVHTVGVGGIVVEDTAGFSVESTHYDKVALVIWLPAEALLSHRQETAVFDRRGAEFTHQQHCIDQHDGHMTLLQMTLNLLNRNRAFFHKDSFTFSLQKEFIHPVLLCVEMLFVEGLVPEALVNAERLCTEAVSDPQFTHEISQVNSPHALCELQVHTCSLKFLFTHWI